MKRGNFIKKIFFEAVKMKQFLSIPNYFKAEGKKSRDDKDHVMELLFSLFEKHQYYNIKDLVKETRQPVTYLKTILNEVRRPTSLSQST